MALIGDAFVGDIGSSRGILSVVLGDEGGPAGAVSCIFVLMGGSDEFVSTAGAFDKAVVTE